MKAASDAPNRPAIRYYGGKWEIAPWIISHFPEHKNYIEPCGGAASVLIQKPRSELETYNDIDGNVVNFFRVLRDNLEELVEKLKLTPWARDEFDHCRTEASDPVENARRFFVSSFMGISCMPFDRATGWRSVSYSDQYYRVASHSFTDLVEGDTIKQLSRRLLGVQIENRDYEYIINRYSRHDTLVYFDPPYVQSKRSCKNKYAKEFSEQDHVHSSDLLNECDGYVVVSGYACDLYKKLYEDRGWERFDKEFRTNSNGRRVESVWLSPRTVEALNRPTQARMFA